MDSNAALLRMLDKALKILDADNAGKEPEPEDAVELAEAVMDLHSWIRNGGFLPERWTRGGRL